MAVEIGQVVSGKVTGITHFGAFVNLPDNQSGLVHISEISEGFVKDINDILSVGDEVEVKVLKMTPDGKINLSIRQAKKSDDKESTEGSSPARNKAPHQSKPTAAKPQARPSHNQRQSSQFDQGSNREKSSDFDQLMSNFLKDSEDRLTSLRRNTEGKRGGRGGRRG